MRGLRSELTDRQSVFTANRKQTVVWEYLYIFTKLDSVKQSINNVLYLHLGQIVSLAGFLCLYGVLLNILVLESTYNDIWKNFKYVDNNIFTNQK